MKKAWYPILVVAALMILIGMACSISGKNEPTPAPTLPPAPTAAPAKACEPTLASPLGIIRSVTLAEDAAAETYDPIHPTVNFVNPAALHAIVALQDAPEDTRIAVEWFTNQIEDIDPDMSMGDYELTTDGTRNLDFSFVPNDRLPAGTYYAVVSLNGEFFLRLDFSVQTK